MRCAWFGDPSLELYGNTKNKTKQTTKVQITVLKVQVTVHPKDLKNIKDTD